MSGRPVRLLAAATVAAAASLLSISAASASCYSGCGGGYAAPVAYYTAPVVYSYSYATPVSYAAPASYASPCSPCGGSYGYGSYSYAPSQPMYVVNQGPSYNAPVIGEAEVEDTGYRRPYPYMGEGGLRWHRRHWQRGYGYRSHGYGYRGHRYGYRSYGYGARFGYRSAWRARHAIVGHGGIWRGGMHRMHGPRIGMHGPHMGMHGPRHMDMHRMHMNRMPGVVHPMGGPRKKWP